MKTIRDSVYVLVAAASLVMAACQPSEGPDEQMGKDADHATRQIGNQVDKTAQRAGKSTELAQSE